MNTATTIRLVGSIFTTDRQTQGWRMKWRFSFTAGTRDRAHPTSDVTLDRSGRIYATADGNADSGSGSVPVGVNTCRLVVDGTPFTNDFVIAADFSPSESFSFAGVTEQLAAGTHTVRMDCKGNGTLPGPRIFFPTLTTLKLGSG